MKWGNVFIAAIFEVGWVMGLKYAHSLIEWGATIVCIIVSFYLLMKATSVLPVGTLYAVFTGLGTAGTVLIGMVLGELGSACQTAFDCHAFVRCIRAEADNR